MRERVAAVGVTGAVVGAFGLCCGLPVLFSLGVLGAVAGISLGSWVLIALGLAAVIYGVWRRRHRRPDQCPARPGAVTAHEGVTSSGAYGVTPRKEP